MLKSLVFAAVLALSLGTGSYMDQDASDPKWKANLEVMMQSGLLRAMSSDQIHITEVKTQVVAGLNTFYRIHLHNGGDGMHCNLTVYTDLSQQNHVTEDTCHLRAAGMMGGFSPVTDQSAPEFEEAISTALKMASNMVNSMYRLVQTKILSAEQQVVAGIKYHIKIEVALSDCLKTSQDNAACAVSTNSQQRYVVDAIVVWQAWVTPQYSVTSIQVA